MKESLLKRNGNGFLKQLAVVIEGAECLGCTENLAKIPAEQQYMSLPLLSQFKVDNFVCRLDARVCYELILSINFHLLLFYSMKLVIALFYLFLVPFLPCLRKLKLKNIRAWHDKISLFFFLLFLVLVLLSQTFVKI